MKLHLFTIGGKTYTFTNAVIQFDNESILTFEYSAQSDGLRKLFVARKEALVGHSFTKEKK